MTITRDTLLGAIDRIAAAMERDFDLLNSADAALGDGDLGVTMTRGMRAIVAMKDDLPEDIGMALLGCAQAFTKSSGSSYGTLMATGLMSAAKELRGQQEIESESIPGLIAGARDKMQARGKAELGGKTVLDSLDYVARTTDKADDKASAAAEAVDRALEDFRDKPATVGRARIFGEKSIGLDDPGMLAMQSVIRAAVDK
ncbi:dihydroxyacetone kinase subunit L [Dinoroseobacter sp. PD6]|uniref:dihydroxyacetone kinase subunit L n=1 Tax=Dinoroseobacter sp. PD6 TaxID=3028384 RepID=UPI00237A8C9B|nr:dihydroxyacetone kinase subunit L [Dinoroseobacter sp. PD6]MDD9717476.1 dihydroxyacetone kinase subunit L [Dinoroseobacter sp. PD6]